MSKPFLSIREAAEKWNVSERRINQYCAEGRIPGAQKFGKSWAIPAGAEKPGDPRRARRPADSTPAEPLPGRILNHENLMPLMNTVFAPGHCREAVENMPAGARRDIALAEYYYFSGQSEAAAKAAQPYLTGPDIAGADTDGESYGIYGEEALVISGSGSLNVTGGRIEVGDEYYAYSSGINAYSVAIESGEVSASGGSVIGGDAES